MRVDLYRPTNDGVDEESFDTDSDIEDELDLISRNVPAKSKNNPVQGNMSDSSEESDELNI
ncbi:hypothetical protein HYPSUDRAFT_920420 [Hypholoma sublateritium FD-334 SS-4]|uniref:Uncharacterized protein n=1 Tax=Hypholoma sublateritium (strain FD-334 SS-4) TaxID=945553 RepID=A0A0D2NPM4_HYPSF|nr:hypothetical protein HYPSUDRAFT_920420 [Hypholoma sublateritium FD-334 SS-4]